MAKPTKKRALTRREFTFEAKYKGHSDLDGLVTIEIEYEPDDRAIRAVGQALQSLDYNERDTEEICQLVHDISIRNLLIDCSKRGQRRRRQLEERGDEDYCNN